MNKNIILIFTGLLLLSNNWFAQDDNTLLAQQDNASNSEVAVNPLTDTALADQMMERANYLYNANRFDSLAILASQASTS